MRISKILLVFLQSIERNGEYEMNENKIAFIMCVNDELYEKEAIYYIESLKVPEGFEREILTIRGAESMTSGYNQGMQSSDAKYKVYLHQDVFIIYPYFIQRILEIFQDQRIGMIGMVGGLEVDKIPVMWDGKRLGMLYTNSVVTSNGCLFGHVQGEYQQVQAVDGLLIATQYDILWREDLFKKWDFYDVSQSLEFRKHGYQVVVPSMDKPWCIHDDGVLNLADYFGEMDIFRREYSKIVSEE